MLCLIKNSKRFKNSLKEGVKRIKNKAVGKVVSISTRIAYRRVRKLIQEGKILEIPSIIPTTPSMIIAKFKTLKHYEINAAQAMGHFVMMVDPKEFERIEKKAAKGHAITAKDFYYHEEEPLRRIIKRKENN